jgi:Fur family zinc uptake transcriptional regulator
MPQTLVFGPGGLYRYIEMSRKQTSHVHEHSEPPAPRAVAASLARARARCGARLTDTREAILRLILEAGHPVTAYELLDALSERTGRPRNPPTVYRALEFLLEQGIVSRVESLGAYTICSHIGESHSCVFFLCTCCGEAQEISDASLDSKLAEMASALGFSAEQPVIEVAGLCRNCHHEHGAAHRSAK